MATTAGNLPPGPGLLNAWLGAGDRVFLDTNVLIYASIPAAPAHGHAAAVLHQLRTVGCELWISRQVLREYLSAVTRPQSYGPPTPMPKALANVRTIINSLLTAEDGPGVTTHLFNLLAQVPVGGKQIHDANIVATILAHGIPNLLTDNVADFTRFSRFITVIPLLPPAPPAAPPGVP